MKTTRMLAALLALASFALTAAPARVSAQGVLLKDIARVQGVTNNQLVGYGLITGLNQTGDSTSVLFTSKTLQNVLQSFGLSTTSQDVRTRNVAAVIVTASLPPFAHSGDTVDVTVSSMGDATSLQGGTLILTELKAPNNLVYATAQGPISVGGFSATPAAQLDHQESHHRRSRSAGRPDRPRHDHEHSAGCGGLLVRAHHARLQDGLARRAALNGRFGAGTARALDAETIRVNMPRKYTGDPVSFLADASDLKFQADALAKVVVNERTGTIVMGGDITLAPVAIAHGNLSIVISTNNGRRAGRPFSNAPTVNQSNTTIQAKESGRKLIYINGAASLSQVVRALNTIGVSPRDLIAIVQALREAGSLQADIDII